MKKHIKESLDNKLFNIREYFKDEKITPSILCSLNESFELSVRLDIINKIFIIIDKQKDYIYSNRTNCEHTNGQIKALDDLKKEIENGTTKF